MNVQSGQVLQRKLVDQLDERGPKLCVRIMDEVGVLSNLKR